MKKVNTIKEIRNSLKVRELHEEFGFAGGNQWGWWCYLNEGWVVPNESSTINERTIKEIAYKVNQAVKQ